MWDPFDEDARPTMLCGIRARCHVEGCRCCTRGCPTNENMIDVTFVLYMNIKHRIHLMQELDPQCFAESMHAATWKGAIAVHVVVLKMKR